MKTWQHGVGAIGLAVAIRSTSAFAFAAPHPGANPVQNDQGPEKVTVNGKFVTSDQAPRMVDGTLMVPLRAVIEAAGGTFGGISRRRLQASCDRLSVADKPTDFHLQSSPHHGTHVAPHQTNREAPPCLPGMG